MSASWTVTEDTEMVSVRVELWNGAAVVVCAWKDDSAAPFVALSTTEHGQHDLSECNFRAFRAWLGVAQGRR
jgi:hypothetical protein